MSDELRPVFVVTVTLDGDDDADIQTSNARRALIRDYTLKVAS